VPELAVYIIVQGDLPLILPLQIRQAVMRAPESMVTNHKGTKSKFLTLLA